MTKATALKVADLLGLTEEYLAIGRPRKAPGKPRPEATDIHGHSINRITRKIDYWQIDKVSLVGAVKFAAIDQGYSKAIRDIASDFISDEAYLKGWGYARWRLTLEELDEFVFDTRELRRIIKAARRDIERSFSL